jgi:hypothetical protein
LISSSAVAARLFIGPNRRATVVLRIRFLLGVVIVVLVVVFVFLCLQTLLGAALVTSCLGFETQGFLSGGSLIDDALVMPNVGHCPQAAGDDDQVDLPAVALGCNRTLPAPLKMEEPPCCSDCPEHSTRWRGVIKDAANGFILLHVLRCHADEAIRPVLKRSILSTTKGLVRSGKHIKYA